MKKSTTITVIATAAVVAAVAATGIGIAVSTQTAPDTSATSVPQASPSASVTATMKPTTAPAEVSSLEANLAYLIEEEKLAHDVYTVLGEMWGSKTMSNIVNSEDSHEAQVATVLVAYGFADPRSSEVGVFVNPELQALFDSFIAQGSASETAAMEVGVIIEETDIADLDEMMAVTTEPDALAMMASLRSGSENHLAAFLRQL
jgi:hypothetical protein